MESMVNNSKGMLKQFNNIYKDRKVLITGHTGFKGSWLSLWLRLLEAHVAGFSAYLPSKPCNFEVLGLEGKIIDYIGDIRNYSEIKQAFDKFKPEIVFHLAAQSITRKSYDDPKLTFDTNLGGTINVLECIRTSSCTKAGVIITSDKCYRNLEWSWGYRENDLLGGDDPYSASKACAENACHSYIKSFFSKDNSPNIATTRAGNVIGGGDWATDRIIPDCIRAFSKKKILEIRSPKATRPWQHVLEPLSGYLWLGANLLQKKRRVSGESFNFGPAGDVNKSVEELIREFAKVWGNGNWRISASFVDNKKESTILKLNCDKALEYLMWQAVLPFLKTVKMTADWYKAFYLEKKEMYRFSINQIKEYVNLAQKSGLIWTR